MSKFWYEKIDPYDSDAIYKNAIEKSIYYNMQTANFFFCSNALFFPNAHYQQQINKLKCYPNIIFESVTNLFMFSPYPPRVLHHYSSQGCTPIILCSILNYTLVNRSN